MSGDYASRLKEYPNKGVCGLPESIDTKRSLQLKTEQLASWWKQAQCVVVLTGAGISTAAGIPDFRGPQGIWTLEKQKKQRNLGPIAKRRRVVSGKAESTASSSSSSSLERTNTDTSTTTATDINPPPIPFDLAKPTNTHKALYYLWKKGRLQHLVTQNVDGLHRRSGFTRDAMSVLHGCVYTEKCEACGHEYFRDEGIQGIGFSRTGRFCTHCPGALRDTLLDWEDPLPEDDWQRSQEYCRSADLIVALGTSLRIEPAAGLVELGTKYAIVNLQVTPYDEGAALIIRAKVDDLMQALLSKLGYIHNSSHNDWQQEVTNPKVQRESSPIGPRVSDWWKTADDDEEKDD